MTVQPIRPGVVLSEGKQAFLDTVAEAYDRLAENADQKPVALVFALVNTNGGVRSGYHTLENDGMTSLYVSRGVVALNVDVTQWDMNA